MIDHQLKFPLIKIRRNAGSFFEALVEWFDDEEDLTCLRYDKFEQRSDIGAILIDESGRCRQIEDVVDRGPWGRGLCKLVNTIFREDRLAEYRYAMAPTISWAEVRERVVDAIRANPGYWRDDEAVAGEDGPPRDEEEMLEERIEAVRRSTSMQELIAALRAD